MHQRASLPGECGIGLLPEETGPGPVTRRVQQAKISDRARSQRAYQAEKIFQAEELHVRALIGHARPSLSRTSPHRSCISAVASRTRAVCATSRALRRIARSAASCKDTCSASARALSSALSSSSNLRFIATELWYHFGTTLAPLCVGIQVALLPGLPCGNCGCGLRATPARNRVEVAGRCHPVCAGSASAQAPLPVA